MMVQFLSFTFSTNFLFPSIIYKYFAGLPFYRQCSIQKLLGVKISASTVFDQVELVCNDIYPVYQALFNLAANGEHYYLDDTTNHILDAKPIEKPVRTSDKMRLRSGVYTSGIIATTKDNRAIVLFEINIGHAGEFIDSIFHKRSKGHANYHERCTHQQPPITVRCHVVLM
ncbi:MAG: transposase [Psychrobium sp.]|nr:transposase [Psychrobium sp.]